LRIDVIAILLVNTPVLLHGGSGNDVVGGSGGSDLLFGGAGADILFGAGGDDLLVGDGGSDLILSSQGDDILVGGHVSTQMTDDVLRGVLEQWHHNIQNAEFEEGLTDDGAVDAMFDSFGDDWFVGGNDLSVDLNPFDQDAMTVV